MGGAHHPAGLESSNVRAFAILTFLLTWPAERQASGETFITFCFVVSRDLLARRAIGALRSCVPLLFMSGLIVFVGSESSGLGERSSRFLCDPLAQRMRSSSYYQAP